MLALKKKREAELKAKKAESSAAVSTPSTEAPTNKISLLGVGGKKTKASSDNGTTEGKRMTPGEIRIQKGTNHPKKRKS